MTDDVKTRLAESLADAPQGTRDSQMPPANGPGPNPQGQVGPSPTSDQLPSGDPAAQGISSQPTQTNQEMDWEAGDAGGVNAANTDGSTRTSH